MTRKNLSTRCCHCASRIRVLYQSERSIREPERFRLRFDCPVCHTPLLFDSGEVFYDESALRSIGAAGKLKVMAAEGSGQERAVVKRPRAGRLQPRFNSAPRLTLVE